MMTHQTRDRGIQDNGRPFYKKNVDRRQQTPRLPRPNTLAYKLVASAHYVHIPTDDITCPVSRACLCVKQKSLAKVALNYHLKGE